MKKIFTLAAAGALATASLGAQAQVIIDGTLSATEISATGYQLVGTYTNARGFGDYGLVSLYAAADAGKIYFFVGGTVQGPVSGDRNSFQLYIDRPNVTGAAAGANLPKPAETSATSFKLMDAKMELSPDLAVAIRGNGTTNRLELQAVAYTATTATDAVIGSVAINDAGGVANAVTLTTANASGAFAPLVGAMVAYKGTTDGKVTSNPGAIATGVAYGAAGTTGWEISFDRTAMGLTAAGGVVRVFALQNNGDGGFLSSDFIAQQTPGTAGAGTNLGGFYSNPTKTVDFGTVPGLQSAAITLGATGLTLANRTAVAKALNFGVYPNPGAKVNVNYTVPQGQQDVSLSVFDATGRQVRSFNAAQAGKQSYELNNLRAGLYVVKLSVGGQETSGKVVIE